MLNYRVNTRKFNKTSVGLVVEKLSFTDFYNLVDDSGLAVDYDGSKLGKIMIRCECADIDKMVDGSFINTINTLYLNYGVTDENYQDVYTFNNEFQTIGVNGGNKSFSFYIDKYFTLKPERITTGGDSNENNDRNNVYLHFEEPHYFDIDASATKPVTVYFKYLKNNGQSDVQEISFSYVSPYVLVSSYDNFDSEDKKNLYELIFETNIENDKLSNAKIYVNQFDEDDKKTQEEYDALDEEEKQFFIINNTEKEGNLGGIEIYRDNFLFGEKTNYEINFERPLVELNVPIVNTFETTLYQMELLNEHFVESEKKKAINRITDIEKDVYYPCVSNLQKTKFTDVYTIKFNLHFREHRGEDWLVENGSFWNGVKCNVLYVKGDERISVEDYNNLSPQEQTDYTPLTSGSAQIAKYNNNIDLTRNDLSDLLSYLGFTNSDVHYQKNKLKKSFLRLMYFNSPNPANQNMIGYSTIFLDSGDLFAKYIRYIEEGGYIAVGADKKTYGQYDPKPNKQGIGVDRDIFDEDKRLSTQLVVKSKNTSKASSEGFYIYIWKDNEMALPQDLYMKVEFNHAGYGRTVPFMMPYWDKKKWNNTENGIKTLQQILDDWNSKAEEQPDQNNRIVWKYNGKETDGHYGIRQYTKFSYIHLKYQYDKENDKHIYYLDPDTYGNDVTSTNDDNELIINLYEAKVE